MALSREPRSLLTSLVPDLSFQAIVAKCCGLMLPILPHHQLEQAGRREDQGGLLQIVLVAPWLLRGEKPEALCMLDASGSSLKGGTCLGQDHLQAESLLFLKARPQLKELKFSSSSNIIPSPVVHQCLSLAPGHRIPAGSGVYVSLSNPVTWKNINHRLSQTADYMRAVPTRAWDHPTSGCVNSTSSSIFFQSAYAHHPIISSM